MLPATPECCSDSSMADINPRPKNPYAAYSLVQIPLWPILTTELGTTWPYVKKVQIPLWPILTWNMDEACDALNEVQIPLWPILTSIGFVITFQNLCSDSSMADINKDDWQLNSAGIWGSDSSMADINPAPIEGRRAGRGSDSSMADINYWRHDVMS